MKPTIKEWTQKHVQAALDEISREVTKISRQGTTEIHKPTYFSLPLRENVKKLGKDMVFAWDATTKKIVRWTGSAWEDVT
ncbi:MAG: hypothetical protein ABFE13_11360 [Phycisphaerales bacterium]